MAIAKRKFVVAIPRASLIEFDFSFNVSLRSFLRSLDITIAGPDDGYFLPILTFQGFNGTEPAYGSKGFSIGFHYRKSPTSSATASTLYDTYLAVCCGLANNYYDLYSASSVYLR